MREAGRVSEALQCFLWGVGAGVYLCHFLRRWRKVDDERAEALRQEVYEMAAKEAARN